MPTTAPHPRTQTIHSVPAHAPVARPASVAVPGSPTRDLRGGTGHARRPVRGGGAGLMAWGVVLPAITILVELGTRMCADTFFDPMPTPFHVLLALSVPAANLAAWLVLNEAAAG